MDIRGFAEDLSPKSENECGNMGIENRQSPVFVIANDKDKGEDKDRVLQSGDDNGNTRVNYGFDDSDALTGTHDEPHHVSIRDRAWAKQFTGDLTNDEFALSLSYNEEKLFGEIEAELCTIGDTEWASIDDDVFFPKDKVIREGGLGVGRIVGVVQTSPERMLAW